MSPAALSCVHPTAQRCGFSPRAPSRGPCVPALAPRAHLRAGARLTATPAKSSANNKGRLAARAPKRRVRTCARTGDETQPANENPYKGMKVLVAGANGGVGLKMVEKLRAVGVPVVALVRDKAKADSSLLAEGVELLEGDVYQYQTLPRVMQGCTAVLCATGSRPALDPLGPFNVDYQGTKNLIVAATRAEVQHFVFVTSIGVDDILFPLNLFWGVLFWKKRAEEELQRSGLKYTIVRPGGLQDAPREGGKVNAIVMKGANAYGLPPKTTPGSILRSQVADVCVAALVEPDAANKIVEVVTDKKASEITFASMYYGVQD